MDRRRFLRRAGALSVLGLAGCTADANDGGDRDGSDGSDGSETATPTDTAAPIGVASQSIATVETGCRSGDGATSVYADESARTVTVTGSLTTSNPCYEAVLESVTYDADSDTLRVDVGAESTGGVCVQCVGAVEYSATVAFDGGVPDGVEVAHRGETVLRCGAATEQRVADASLSVTDVSNSVAETTADVEFDEDAGTVVVTGTIEGSNGCKTATIGGVCYDPSTDTLSVDVRTTNREDADGTVGCTQALVYIDYRVTVTFEGDISNRVSVRHDGRGVISAGYDSATASAPKS